MNAIEMLKKDHREVDALFEAFEAVAPEAFESRRRALKRIIHALRTHAAIEEDVFYPEVEARVDGIVKQDAHAASGEHRHINRLLDALALMDPADAQFDARVRLLKQEVQAHVQQEEQGMFAHVRQKLGAGALKEVAEALVEDRDFVDRQVSAVEARENSRARL